MGCAVHVVKYSDMSTSVGWYQSVCFFNVRSVRQKEEGVAPSSSGLLDQEGGVSNSPFPSSHLSSVGASGKPSTDQVREKVRKRKGRWGN